MLRQFSALLPQSLRALQGSVRLLHSVSSYAGSVPADYSVLGEEMVADTRVSSVALVGAPNAGKSSLMNALIGNRISAVSRKVNTTRNRTVGVYTEGSRQLLFWDTPGVVEKQFIKGLGPERRELTTAGWGAAADADVAVMVVDVSRGLQYWKRCAIICEQLGNVRRLMKASAVEMDEEDEGRRVGVDGSDADMGLFLVLNKCDITRPRTRLLEAVSFFQDSVEGFADNFEEQVYMLSAYNGRGVDDLRNALLDRAKPGDFEVEPGTTHCEDDLDLIREHIWEKLLHCLHQKVPYTCKFENDGLIELPNGDVHLSEIIRVPRTSVVPIVIGPRGRTIQWIRDTAMVSASQALGRQVHLKLRVKVA